MMKKYLTSDEYCDIYRISKATLYRHIKSGIVEYKKLGNKLLFPYHEDEKIEVQNSYSEKSELESLIDKISPDIMELLLNPPKFGHIKIEITYHHGLPVLIDCGRSIKKKVIGKSNE